MCPRGQGQPIFFPFIFTRLIPSHLYSPNSLSSLLLQCPFIFISAYCISPKLGSKDIKNDFKGGPRDAKYVWHYIFGSLYLALRSK